MNKKLKHKVGVNQLNRNYYKKCVFLKKSKIHSDFKGNMYLFLFQYTFNIFSNCAQQY